MECPSCGVENETNAAFCDHCGASLGISTPPRAPVPQAHTPPPNTPPAPSVAPAQPPYPPPPETIALPVVPCRLVIASQEVIVPLKKQVIVGRSDPITYLNPDVDLTPFGGTPEAGVSRKHIKIVWQGAWLIEDLNSTNGTYLRGQRLVAGLRTPIRNGEMLQVGKLQVTFFTQ